MFIRRKVLRSELCAGTLLAPERPRDSIHQRTRSLRPPASLLSTFPTLAGVAPETSRSIKPARARSFVICVYLFWSGFLRGQRTHPRHAVCAFQPRVEASAPPCSQSLLCGYNLCNSVTCAATLLIRWHVRSGCTKVRPMRVRCAKFFCSFLVPMGSMT